LDSSSTEGYLSVTSIYIHEKACRISGRPFITRLFTRASASATRVSARAGPCRSYVSPLPFFHLLQRSEVASILSPQNQHSKIVVHPSAQLNRQMEAFRKYSDHDLRYLGMRHETGISNIRPYLTRATLLDHGSSMPSLT